MIKLLLRIEIQDLEDLLRKSEMENTLTQEKRDALQSIILQLNGVLYD